MRARAIERLQDLDALAHPDRKRADPRAGIDREPVARGEFADLVARRARDRGTARAGARPEDDILPDGQRVEQLERLMHHAHARRDRVERRAETDLLAAQPDRSLVRPLQAVDEAHQRRLARAVLAHDRVDLADLGRKDRHGRWRGAAVALDDADRLELRRPSRRAAYFAIMGSATLTAPLTI